MTHDKGGNPAHQPNGAGPTAREVLALDEELNRSITRGRFLDAFLEFYHPEALVPPAVAPTTDDARDMAARAVAFFDWVETFIGTLPLRSVACDDATCSQWVRDAKDRDGRRRVREQWIARRWVWGRVIDERVTLRPPSRMPSNRAPGLPSHRTRHPEPRGRAGGDRAG